MKSRKLYLLLSLSLLTIIPISSHLTTPQDSTADYWPTLGWKTSTPEAQGMVGGHLDAMVEQIKNDSSLRVDSVVIVKNGYIVGEEYFSFYQQNTLHPVYSITKSFVSALVGIAINESYIGGVDQKILGDFFPNKTFAEVGSLKKNITLEHILTMSSGLYWNELDVPYRTQTNNFNQMLGSSDWVEFVLNRSVITRPGTMWEYNSGGSHLLSVILTQATGMDTLSYAQQKIFNPLGITNVLWTRRDPQNVYFGGSDMQLTPRSLAKFGYLYLNNGTWDGQQIVPADWVHASHQDYVRINQHMTYGYQFWIGMVTGSYTAVGYGGQRIYIFPDLDLVVVFNSNFGPTCCPTDTLIYNYILPSVEGVPFVPSTTSTLPSSTAPSSTTSSTNASPISTTTTTATTTTPSLSFLVALAMIAILAVAVRKSRKEKLD